MLLAYGFLRKVFEVFEKYRTPIDMITTSEVAVSLTIDSPSALNDIVRELETFSTVDVDKDQTIISIVGNEIGEQRDAEQDEEDPERPIAAPVGLEILPAAAVERRRRKGVAGHGNGFAERRLRRGLDRLGRCDRHQTSRASKSIRGSIHM